jgi:glycosyltransferase involved in cell wall biosynthesis
LKNKKISEWSKLDNAAKIFPANSKKSDTKVPEDRIYNTINGINLDRFKPSNDKDRKGILHISRLDDDTSLIAEKLIEYGRANQDIRITIVGDGSEAGDLKRQAKGLSNVVFTGKVSKVEKYLDEAKIFIGVSRAALEAMCYNK